MLGDRGASEADFVEVKKKHGFQLLVDDAHSFGVLGPNGRGLGDEDWASTMKLISLSARSRRVWVSIGGFGAGNHPLFEHHPLCHRGPICSPLHRLQSPVSAATVTGRR